MLLLVLNLSGLPGGTTRSSMQRGPGQPGPSVLCGPAAREPPPPGRGVFTALALPGRRVGGRTSRCPFPGNARRPTSRAAGVFPPRSPAPCATAGENIQPRVGAVAAGRPPPPAHKGLIASSSAERRQRSGSLRSRGARHRRADPRPGPGPPCPRRSPPSSHRLGAGSRGAGCAPGGPAPSR